MQPSPELHGRELRPLPLLTGDDDTGCCDTGEAGETKNLPQVHEQETLPVNDAVLSLMGLHLRGLRPRWVSEPPLGEHWVSQAR